jgi:hypothetical protein
MRFSISTQSDLVLTFIPFLIKYPILGIKLLDLEDFCKILMYVRNKEHSTCLDEIEKIRDRMNRKRDLDSQFDDPLRFKEIIENISSMGIVSSETIKQKALHAERRESVFTMLNSTETTLDPKSSSEGSLAELDKNYNHPLNP